MKKENDIESLFKDAFDAYEVDPGTSAWGSIQSGIQASASKATAVGANVAASSGGVSSAFVTTIVALSIGAVAIVGYFYFDEQGKSKEVNKKELIVSPKEAVKAESFIEETLNQEVDKLEVESTADEVQQNKNTEKTTKKVGIKTELSEKKKIEKVVALNEETENLIVEQAVNDSQKQALSKENNQGVSTNNTTTETHSASKENQQIQENNSIPASKTDALAGDSEVNKNEVQSEPIAENAPNEENHLVSTIFENIQNVFTPNQDGTNDIFMVHAEGVDRIEVQVFSRNQRLIHEWKSIYGYWDGTMPDKTTAPEGIYFYNLTIEINGKTYSKKGSLTLLK